MELLFLFFREKMKPRIIVLISWGFVSLRLYRIDLHAAFAAPDEYENKLPPHPGPLPPRGEGKKNKRIQSSFSLDGRR